GRGERPARPARRSDLLLRRGPHGARSRQRDREAGELVGPGAPGRERGVLPVEGARDLGALPPLYRAGRAHPLYGRGSGVAATQLVLDKWGAPRWPPIPPSLRSVPAKPCRSSEPRRLMGPRNGPIPLDNATARSSITLLAPPAASAARSAARPPTAVAARATTAPGATLGLWARLVH